MYECNTALKRMLQEKQEKLKAASKARYAFNPDKQKAASKAHYRANSDKKEAAANAHSKACYRANPDKKKVWKRCVTLISISIYSSI